MLLDNVAMLDNIDNVNDVLSNIVQRCQYYPTLWTSLFTKVFSNINRIISFSRQS